MNVKIENIPSRLRARENWVCWTYEVRAGEEKPTKVLYCPKTGKRARTHNNPDPKFPYHNRPSQTWDRFDRAWWACRKFRNCNGQEYDGIGYVFSDNDPFAGLDMDKCYDDGVWTPEAYEYAHTLGSYTEISPSGRGVKIIVEAYVPGARCRTGNLEFYDRWRYFTITGNRVEHFQLDVEERIPEYNSLYWKTFPVPEPKSTPFKSNTVEVSLSDQDILSKAFSAKNGPQLIALYSGDKSEFAWDDSEADASLAWRLAFWTKDPSQIERIMRSSALCREKWDESRGVTTWVGREVAVAIDAVNETYGI